MDRSDEMAVIWQQIPEIGSNKFTDHIIQLIILPVGTIWFFFRVFYVIYKRNKI